MSLGEWNNTKSLTSAIPHDRIGVKSCLQFCIVWLSFWLTHVLQVKNLKMIPRESNKGYMAKTGRCVGTRVRNKTRIVIWPFRTHKPLLLKSPSERLVWSAFAKRQCGLLALTKVKQEAIHIRSNPKTSTGIRPWKMNSPAFAMAPWNEACCKACWSQVVQNGDNSVSVKILQVHIM